MSSVSTVEVTATVSPEKDRTGRSRLVSNVLFTWAGQMVFFVSGFIMPRLIDHKLGHEVLGVWDYSWAAVTYFRFVDMGVTASVNRYVGRYWSVDDIPSINRVVSSATFALCIGGAVIVLGTIGVALSLPYWSGISVPEYIVTTQWSTFWLGMMLAGGTALGAFNGVLTGCHRWELQTMRNSVWQFITVAAMIVALFLGAGLATLAAITAIGQILGQLTMVTLAYHACPGLQLKRAHVKAATIKELYIYSGKTLLPTASEMLLNQTTSVLITSAAPLRPANANTNSDTHKSDAPVASGASCTIERIMAAKMTACPELRTTVPSSSGISPPNRPVAAKLGASAACSASRSPTSANSIRLEIG